MNLKEKIAKNEEPIDVSILAVCVLFLLFGLFIGGLKGVLVMGLTLLGIFACAVFLVGVNTFYKSWRKNKYYPFGHFKKLLQLHECYC